MFMDEQELDTEPWHYPDTAALGWVGVETGNHISGWLQDFSLSTAFREELEPSQVMCVWREASGQARVHVQTRPLTQMFKGWFQQIFYC